jgi:hypothetical protein
MLQSNRDLALRNAYRALAPFWDLDGWDDIWLSTVVALLKAAMEAEQPKRAQLG